MAEQGDNRIDAHRARLYHRLQVTARELATFADRVVGDTGLTTSQLAAMAVVEAEQPVPQRVIAERLRMRESAVTAMVRRLEDVDFVERRVDPGDARVRLLCLTAEGESCIGEARAAFAVVNDVLDASLGVTGVAALADSLDRIREAILPADGDGDHA